MEYDENKAIEYMRRSLPDDVAKSYDDDEYLNVIDLIWDFYEENGLLDIDGDEDIEEDALLDDLIEYAKRMIKKDKSAVMRLEHIEPIIKAEIEYESTLDEGI
ncbi:MAG: hypothetical protein J6C78_06075 [Muribaculaceae bacterium]|nr:hypothetical protein [Muribaculaceae bacterium]